MKTIDIPGLARRKSRSQKWRYSGNIVQLIADARTWGLDGDWFESEDVPVNGYWMKTPYGARITFWPNGTIFVQGPADAQRRVERILDQTVRREPRLTPA